jgi:spore coat polysaccharide biosynthesis protein SpsF
MNIVTVIQARTTSSRLPNKVLLPLCNEPLLIRMIERIKKSYYTSNPVVATSTNKEDDVIQNLCESHGIDCFRGHLTDLLDRHYQLAITYKADAVVKIPSDCPLIDPNIIDKVIGYYLENHPHYHFVSNLHPASYPDGNDIEIMSFGAIEIAWKEASRNFEREHTTPYLWENPDRFKIGNVLWETGLDFSSTHRWTIDYEEDYQFINRVFEELYHKNPLFGLCEILALIEKRPEIAEINQKYAGKYWYENHLTDLRNINEYKLKIIKNEFRNNSFN